MAITDMAPTVAMRNNAFAALLFATQGLLMLELWSLRLGLRPAANIIGTMFGIAMVGFMFRKVFLHFPSSMAKAGKSGGFQWVEILRPEAAAASLLAAVLGYTSFAIPLAGWISPLILVAAVMLFMPWGRLLAHRTSCIVCWAAALAGSTLATLSSSIHVSPMAFPVACWILWTLATTAWLTLLGHTRSWKRASAVSARR